MSTALERQFRRVVPIAAAASLVLAAYNWWGARENASSPLDAALNLFQWERVALILVAILVVVIITEIVVTQIRKRML